jgi:glycine hydroxymethyltransferase
MSWEKIIQIQEIIRLESQRQEHEIELIASENYVSKDILAANGSILTNKYSEGYPGKRYYAGQKYIDQIENIAIDLAKEIFEAEYVNVQPLSGSPANLAVFSALLVPGDRVLSLSLDHGGHLTHGHPLNESGRLYSFEFYWVDPTTELINMDEVRAKAHEFKPKLIIAGFSAYSRSLDWAAFRSIADEVGALLMGDIAHIAGLVAAKQLQNPIPFCDVVTTTTHKTLRGPRGAIILAREKYAKDLARAVFPGAQGGPHDHTTAAKAIAFAEALSPEFVLYGERVIKNAQEFAHEMIAYGARIVSGWTDNHLFCIDVAASYSIGGKQAELLLEDIGISVNKNMIPFDTRKPLDPSGIRLGTPAVTTRGMGIPEMKILASIVHQSLSSPLNTDLQQSLALQVRALCERFPIYQ